MIIDGEHNTNGEDCWCNPKIEVLENGNKIITHNDITPEDARHTSDILLAIATAQSSNVLFKEIRKKRKLSILDVSNISGVHRNTIGKIESGEGINQASIKTLAAIAHAIRCDLRIELIPFENFTKEK